MLLKMVSVFGELLYQLPVARFLTGNGQPAILQIYTKLYS